jgi:hypothetical protein
MPNGVTYSDEKTLPKVYKALFGEGDLDFGQVQKAIDRMQAAGILFREEVPADTRAPRTTKKVDPTGPQTPETYVEQSPPTE